MTDHVNAHHWNPPPSHPGTWDGGYRVDSFFKRHFHPLIHRWMKLVTVLIKGQTWWQCSARKSTAVHKKGRPLMLPFLSTPHWPPFVSLVFHSFILFFPPYLPPPPLFLSIQHRMRSAANDRKYILEAETGDGILSSQLGLVLDTHAETWAYVHTQMRVHTHNWPEGF